MAYSLGPNPPDTLAAISTRLAAMKRDASDLKVVFAPIVDFATGT